MLPPHIAAKICGHALLDTTMGYAAIYPEDVIAHHRAFIARRRTERPSEEYRDLTDVIRGSKGRKLDILQVVPVTDASVTAAGR